MLSSQEVGTLVTALGCGIGRTEFNPDKLRYHHVIIMTDADVDGSHIRTLLLTFFFRQMPELLERGHIFIAQPPLYKVKKGKQEQYVKDDEELESHFLSVALDGAQLFATPDSPQIAGEQLELLVQQYRKVAHRLEAMDLVYPVAVTRVLLEMPVILMDELKERDRADAWIQLFAQHLGVSLPDDERSFVVATILDPEHQIYVPEVTITHRGVDLKVVLGWDFFNSSNYTDISQVSESLSGLIAAGSRIVRGDREAEVTSFAEMLDWLQQQARRGVTIQRYKGLGEMNPDQLWETTMDPEVRRMLVVTVDDAIAADQMFTTLMGDQVEPRREFIEDNALSVVNLDV